MSVRVAELETVFTGNVKAFEASAVKVETRRKDLTKKPTEVKVTADTKAAEAGMARVEAEGRKITAKDVVATIDANITKAEKGATAIRAQLAVLEATDTTPQVDADIAKAQSNLSRIEASLKAMRGARATLEVQADTSKAESALDDVAKKAGDAGTQGGKDAGDGLSAGIIGALATIPIAGAVVGIGVAIGKSLLDGLQVEVRSDILTARTGLDPETVARVARAAGEAYAGNFGTSIEENMDTARIAIQGGLLDADATVRDSQRIIQSLEGVADIIGEDIARVSRSTATLIRTGLARDSAEAFDIIVKGQQAGLNVSEDWLDTLDEYSTQFRKLGLDGPAAMGLLRQAVQAGARDTDTAADALKEFAIRAIDGSTASAAGFEALGFSAQEMTAKIAQGGTGASEGLDQVLDRLRSMEDPVARDAAAVALFGTKAEDLGAALGAMDLTTAIDQLGAVAGVAQTAVDAMGDNAAGSIATAQRNIEVAADGIKGALATAFNPEIEDFASYVAENREGVMTFLLNIANAGLDMARSVVNGMATGTEAIGGFISGPIADLVDALGDVVLGIDAATPGDQGGKAFREWADEAVSSLRSVEDTTGALADEMRTNLITNAIDPAQQKLNEVAIPMIAQAAVHDASMRLAQSIDTVGYAADGSTLALDTMNGTVDVSTESGRLLDEQLRGVAAALAEETEKGRLAGESQADLTARYEEGRVALVNQLVQMGYTQAQAETLAASYGAVPGTVVTAFSADTADAHRTVENFITTNDGRHIRVVVDAVGGTTVTTGKGNQVGMAMGGLLLARPMSGKLAQVVPPGTKRIIGDRIDVPELFAPLDGSARSWDLLMQGVRQMPGLPPVAMAMGAVVSSSPNGPSITRQQITATPRSMVGLRLEGRLDLGNGIVGMMRAVVKSELADVGSRSTYAGEY